jgi:membrane-bound serine protease (ClpP class)
MTGEVLQIVGLLVLGYVLLLMELFLPGGILGILGLASVVYGCWLAFGLGPAWGSGAVLMSVVMTVGLVILIVRSRTARKLVLDSRPSRDWKAPRAGLEGLLGREGVTLSPLRPAGIVDIDGQRLDVVTDSEFLDRGVRVRVSDVESTRVVVEPVVEAGPPATER